MRAALCFWVSVCFDANLGCERARGRCSLILQQRLFFPPSQIPRPFGEGLRAARALTHKLKIPPEMLHFITAQNLRLADIFVLHCLCL
jgi:hypothetical protein